MHQKFSEKENIFIMKKVFTELVYNTSKLEMINVTLPQTQTLLDGLSVSGLKTDDIQVILNIKNAFRYIINNHADSFDLNIALKINSFVSYNESLEWGVLRTGNVTISGTNYIPNVPIKDDVINEINAIMSLDKPMIYRAVKYMYYAMRKKIFWDGNKRTAIICANYIMLQNGCGALIVKDALMETFNDLLSEYYTTGNDEQIIQWTFDNCLVGLNIN